MTASKKKGRKKAMPFEHNLTNALSDEFFHVNSISAALPPAETVHILRKNGRVDHHILLVLSGEAEIRSDGPPVLLKAGDAYYYAPNVRQEYIKNKTCSCWLHFSGTGAAPLVRRLSYPHEGILYCKNLPETKLLFAKASTEFFSNTPHKDILCAALAVQILAQFSSVRPALRPDDENASLIYAAAQEMQKNFANPITIEELAKKYAMSEGKFSSLFKELIGVPPYKYLSSIRLNYACYLLRGTSLTVSEIAYRSGYDDPLYFSKLFKKKFLLPPGEYRKKPLT